MAGHGAAVPWCWAGVVLSAGFLLVSAVLHRDAAQLDDAVTRTVLGAGIGSVVLVLLLGAWACDRAAKRVLVQEHLEEEHGAGADRR